MKQTLVIVAIFASTKVAQPELMTLGTASVNCTMLGVLQPLAIAILSSMAQTASLAMVAALVSVEAVLASNARAWLFVICSKVAFAARASHFLAVPANMSVLALGPANTAHIVAIDSKMANWIITIIIVFANFVAPSAELCAFP